LIVALSITPLMAFADAQDNELTGYRTGILQAEHDIANYHYWIAIVKAIIHVYRISL
jgi:hypothetical protein